MIYSNSFLVLICTWRILDVKFRSPVSTQIAGWLLVVLIMAVGSSYPNPTSLYSCLIVDTYFAASQDSVTSAAVVKSSIVECPLFFPETKAPFCIRYQHPSEWPGLKLESAWEYKTFIPCLSNSRDQIKPIFLLAIRPVHQRSRYIFPDISFLTPSTRCLYNSILDAINLTSIDTVLFTQSDTVLFNSQILCSSLFTQSDTVLFTQIGVFTPWLSNSKTWEYDNLKDKAPVLKYRAGWFCRSFCHSIAQDFIYWTWLAWNFSHKILKLFTHFRSLWSHHKAA